MSICPSAYLSICLPDKRLENLLSVCLVDLSGFLVLPSCHPLLIPVSRDSKVEGVAWREKCWRLGGATEGGFVCGKNASGELRVGRHLNWLSHLMEREVWAFTVNISAEMILQL
mmetsp:Transcript_46433/g.91629  ORF Transcript_46433/g.91629 Transcript_46433/m.91629 type:complete len:114 (+) Transcript_46433:2527-2868(+)